MSALAQSPARPPCRSSTLPVRLADTVIADYQLDPHGEAAALVRAAAVRRRGKLAGVRLSPEAKAASVLKAARKAGAVQFAGLQVEWATAVAVRRARRYRHRADSDETAEVVGEAVAYLTRRVFAFDPRQCPAGGSVEGLFRGWLLRSLLTACNRMCRIIGNAGTYSKTSRATFKRAVPLSALKAPLAAREPDEPDPGPWEVCDTSEAA